MNNGFVSIVLALILVAGAFLTWLFWDDISGKTKESRVKIWKKSILSR